MKATTLYAIAALALSGVACSETANSVEDAAQNTEISSAPQSSEDSGSGLNLNLPSSMDNSADTGGLNLNLGGASQDDGLLIGSESLGSGELVTDVPDIELPSETEGLDAILAEPETANSDDGIIRLDPK